MYPKRALHPPSTSKPPKMIVTMLVRATFAPQCGQAAALVLISLSHSLHLVSAICLPYFWMYVSRGSRCFDRVSVSTYPSTFLDDDPIV